MDKKTILNIFDARIEQLSIRLKNKKLSPKMRLTWQSSMDELNAMKQLIRNL